MKRLLMIFLVLMIAFAPVSSFAAWVTANQATVMWDANDTSTLMEGEKLVYRVYLANAVTDPDKTNPVVLGETEDVKLTITLNTKGKYRAGVSAVLFALADDGVTWEEVAASEISWSDDPEVTKDGIIFGIRFYPAPAKPGGLTSE